ncbi:MAG: hypothetical protein M3068_05115 [Gemmatimonadota bacterium]|nr:hypothetical protein [Gemmatimonadota bacterium]
MGEELADAIGSYHDLLSDESASRSQAQLDHQLRSRGLYFGARPLCTVLRPRFMAVTQYRHLQQRAAVTLRAFDRAYRRAVEDPLFRSEFGLLEWEERLALEDPGFRESSPTSRLDAFFVDDGGGLRFTEYNAETPAGAAYNDALAEVFLGLPVMREFRRRFEAWPLGAAYGVVDALLDVWAQWSGGHDVPRLAILDWKEVPTYSEFLLYQRLFESQGIPCAIVDPREVEYRGGQLLANGTPIDLIYKRVLLEELVQRGGLDHPVFTAVRNRAVCMVNPARCKILHKKASLAVLSDERHAALFTSEESEAIDQHIPWTRRVEERHTEHQGRRVDLLPFVQQNRDRLVLKPNDEYGGKGIVLGWEVDDSGWTSALQAALSEPYIVQERIILPTEPYPSMLDGSLRVADRMVDTAPFAFHDAYVDGCMTRLGTESLLNVTAGGGSSVPTFLLAGRR